MTYADILDLQCQITALRNEIKALKDAATTSTDTLMAMISHLKASNSTVAGRSIERR